MASRADRVGFTFYSRNYCHPCDELITGLRGLQRDFRFRLDIADVDGDPELEQRYSERVPVLVHAGQELCHY
jgi:hypothetical protein